MAKPNDSKTTNPKTPETKADAPKSNGNGAQAPAGYGKQSADVLGYWKGEGPIHFVPRGVKLFDGSLEKVKPGILIIAELIDPTVLLVKDDEAKDFFEQTGKPHDMIGIWYKPGMRALANLADAKVWMIQTGERDTGKPNPMKLFDVRSPGPNKRLLCISDDRKKSAHVETPFAKARKPVSDTNGDAASDDDFGF